MHRSCMINRILGLKQLTVQVNGHVLFHLHGLRRAVRNGKLKLQNETRQRKAWHPLARGGGGCCKVYPEI